MFLLLYVLLLLGHWLHDQFTSVDLCQVTDHAHCMGRSPHVTEEKMYGPDHTLTPLLAFWKHCFWLTKPLQSTGYSTINNIIMRVRVC